MCRSISEPRRFSTADIEDTLIVGDVIRVEFQVVDGAFVAEKVRNENGGNRGPVEWK